MTNKDLTLSFGAASDIYEEMLGTKLLLRLFKIVIIALAIPQLALADEIESVRQDELGRIDPNLYRNVADDVYVQLYLNRLARARLEVTEQEAIVAYTAKALDRARKLYERQAMSLDEMQSNERDYNAAVASLNQRKARVEEMRAMFNIAVDRISVGLDMPICAEMP